MTEEKYIEFKNYLEKGDLPNAHICLNENPSIKSYLNRDEWEKMYNHLEDSIIKLMCDKLDDLNVNIKGLNRKLSQD